MFRVLLMAKMSELSLRHCDRLYSVCHTLRLSRIHSILKRESKFHSGIMEYHAQQSAECIMRRRTRNDDFCSSFVC